MEIALHQTLVPIAVYTVVTALHTVGMEIKVGMGIVLNIDMWFVQRILHIVIVIAILGINIEIQLRSHWVTS